MRTISVYGLASGYCLAAIYLLTIRNGLVPYNGLISICCVVSIMRTISVYGLASGYRLAICYLLSARDSLPFRY